MLSHLKLMEAKMLDSPTNLQSILSDPSLLQTKAFINNEWVNSENGSTFDVINPARGDVIAKVADLSRADLARAIDGAQTAQKKWAALSAKDRSNTLRAWFNLMMENQADLAKILTAEMGKPLAEAMGEIAYGASFVEFFAEEAKRNYGETIPGHQADKRITVIKQPIGVAASITPWNFPVDTFFRFSIGRLSRESRSAIWYFADFAFK
jgi:succinate-semialdehyde dehydrogenase/glutarate-semialdehyde dehydrogenase